MGILTEKIQRISNFPDDVREAYEHASYHRDEILSSNSVGCFYCCKVFPKSQIVKWSDEDKAGMGQTARCPKCGVEVDVDEDEVEEGEILNCLGCEAELEVVQIHPVSVNVITEDDEDEESEDAEDDGILEEEEEELE